MPIERLDFSKTYQFRGRLVRLDRQWPVPSGDTMIGWKTIDDQRPLIGDNRLTAFSQEASEAHDLGPHHLTTVKQANI